jgi:hypothetical protein
MDVQTSAVSALHRDAQTAAFWQAYLAALPRVEDVAYRFYDIMRIGNSNKSANTGTALIKRR